MSETPLIDAMLAEHAELEKQLADPALHADAAAARKAGRRFAMLSPIVATHRKLATARDDLATARELSADDPSFADEVTGWDRRSPSWKRNFRTCWHRVILTMVTTSCWK